MTAAKEVPSRDYVVRDRKTKAIVAVINAVNKSQARETHTQATILVELATTADIWEAAKAGIVPVDANAWRRQEADAASVRG